MILFAVNLNMYHNLCSFLDILKIYYEKEFNKKDKDIYLVIMFNDVNNFTRNSTVLKAEKERIRTNFESYDVAFEKK